MQTLGYTMDMKHGSLLYPIFDKMYAYSVNFRLSYMLDLNINGR